MFNDDDYGQLATPADAMREYADWVGSENPGRCWILTDYDVWMRNPHYTGPAVPHPEEYDPEECDFTDEEVAAMRTVRELADAEALAARPVSEDDIPF